jgi:hypothetical protein
MNKDDNDQGPEQELWDDKSKETPPMFHAGCKGKIPGPARVTWVTGEEFRCRKCGEAVTSDDMEIPGEPLLRLIQ